MRATSALLGNIVSFTDCHDEWIVYVAAFSFAHKFFTYPTLPGFFIHVVAYSKITHFKLTH